MSNLNDYYHDDDPRARQPDVPDLEKCTNCNLMFPADTMITDSTDSELFCGLECLAKYFLE